MNAIGDYAAIGDGRSVALVGRDGSIDWLCWPRFDSPSVFGALLDPSAGRWRIAPVGPFQAHRRYIEDTNVLETRFDTGSGLLVLTDLMPVASREEQIRLMLPEREILRMIACERGEVEIEWSFAPRPEYGIRSPGLRQAGRLGIRAETAQGLLMFRTDLPLEIGSDGMVRGRARLLAGERAHASLTLAADGPAVLPPLGAWSHTALERTVRWWQSWTSGIRYDGPCREMVRPERAGLEAHGLRSLGCHHRRADHVAARAQSAGRSTGTIASAGCGTRPSPCARCSGWAAWTRPTPS